MGIYEFNNSDLFLIEWFYSLEYCIIIEEVMGCS